jgi:predicted O-methyltransferase YrrM
LNRYAQLLDLIAKHKPFRILEVGTWNGARACELIGEALKHRPEVTYTGFDLFEDATPETDAAESNVKRHFTLEQVDDRLRQFCHGKPVLYELVKGNTRETLHRQTWYADFVWLDGGHSIDTIASDYQALKHCQTVAFDDYYTNDEQGRGIDTSVFGCNQLVAGLPHVLLPVKDPVRGGGYVQIAVVTRA